MLLVTQRRRGLVGANSVLAVLLLSAAWEAACAADALALQYRRQVVACALCMRRSPMMCLMC